MESSTVKRIDACAALTRALRKRSDSLIRPAFFIHESQEASLKGLIAVFLSEKLAAPGVGQVIWMEMTKQQWSGHSCDK